MPGVIPGGEARRQLMRAVALRRGGDVTSAADALSQAGARFTKLPENAPKESEVAPGVYVTPNALANAYNDYDPDVGNIRGGVGLQNFSNPTYAFCSQIGALENVTSVETPKGSSRTSGGSGSTTTARA